MMNQPNSHSSSHHQQHNLRVDYNNQLSHHQGGKSNNGKNMIEQLLSQRRHLQSLTNETQDFISGPQINQDREVDFEYCYGSLARHDTNNNLRVDQQEYLQFVQDLGSNTECLGNLQSLPLELMACWNQLSCECRQRGGDVDCCEGDRAHIPISGVDVLVDEGGGGSETTGSSSPPVNVAEQQFLQQTCLRTDQCVIAFCGVPPPPVIPPPPIGAAVPPPAAAPARKWWAFAFLAILLLCCCRRRWCFFAGGKTDDDEDSSSSESEVLEDVEGGGAKHLVTEEEGEEEGDIPPEAAVPLAALAADHADPNANRQALKATEEDEDGMGGGVMYSRSVQEPEWEEDPVPPKPKAIEQYDPPPPPQQDFALKHVEKDPPPPPPEEPYALEHYVPDGGIVEYERSGEWVHDADGGWVPEEKVTKDPSEWNRAGYEREEHVEPEPVDNRRARHIEGMSGGAIFDHLDEDEHIDTNAQSGAGIGDMFSWVINSTLSTLDQKQDDLRSSGHSRKSEESRESK